MLSSPKRGDRSGTLYRHGVSADQHLAAAVCPLSAAGRANMHFELITTKEETMSVQFGKFLLFLIMLTGSART